MKKTAKLSDYIKAARRGSRDAELEDSKGFKGVCKVHKSKKAYNRQRDKKVFS